MRESTQHLVARNKGDLRIHFRRGFRRAGLIVEHGHLAEESVRPEPRKDAVFLFVDRHRDFDAALLHDVQAVAHVALFEDDLTRAEREFLRSRLESVQFGGEQFDEWTGGSQIGHACILERNARGR